MLKNKTLLITGGTVSYTPAKLCTNKYLESIIDTNAELIEKNLGIKERRIAEKNQSINDLASQSACRVTEYSLLELEK